MQSERETTKTKLVAAGALHGWRIRHFSVLGYPITDFLKVGGDAEPNAWIRAHWDRKGRLYRAHVDVPGFANTYGPRTKNKRGRVQEVLEKFPG